MKIEVDPKIYRLIIDDVKFADRLWDILKSGAYGNFEVIGKKISVTKHDDALIIEYLEQVLHLNQELWEILS